jgi:lipoate-protein ligase B
MKPPIDPVSSFVTLCAGQLTYELGLQLQERLLQERREQDSDVLLLLEHPPVITLGRGAKANHLRLPEATLAARGIPVHRVGRGGDVTYHGPGQLVGYPIVDLTAQGRDLHCFLRLLEETLLTTLAAFGLRGRRQPGCTGVWIGDAKIASIGIGVRHWISWHGFALNVSTDLRAFDSIVPCGLAGVTMTSMEALLGAPIPLAAVEAVLIDAFARSFTSTYQGDYVDRQLAQA